MSPSSSSSKASTPKAPPPPSGLGTRDNKHTRICQPHTFDKDLGWHILKLGEKSTRIWTKDGYRDIKQWTTW